jgi:putative ABC transport system permease protein
VLGRVAGRLPIGPRIAFRDLARYSGRSSTALAAIALAVALPTIVVVAARAAEAGEDEGNLSARQALIRIGDDRLYVPERSADQLRRLEDIVQTMSNQAEGQTVPLVVPVDHIESTTRGADVLHPAVVLGRRVKENTIRDVDQLYVATAVLADNLGLRSAQLEGAADVFTSQNGTLEYANAARGTDAPRVRRIITPGYASAPTSLITERALHANGWTAAPAGWLLESAEPINEEIVDSLREAAGAAGLTVEVRDEQGELGVIRSAAVAVGVLVALGVLALSLALLRVEAQGDLRTLAATGAPRSTRRAINASRGAGLAAAGAVVGVTMAYGGLVAGYGKDRSSLSHVPLVELGLLLVGLPLLAFAASWLLSGRPSHALRRASIE